MNDRSIFKRITAISAFLTLPFALANTIVLLIAVDFNTEFMANPANLITIGTNASETFRWGEIIGLGAPTLLLVPAAFYLWYWLKPRAPRLVTLYTFFGLTSLLIAAIGSLMRATFYPPLMSAYSLASETQRDVLMVVFKGITDFNFEGLWALELIFSGIWWLGIGPILRSERRILGNVTIGLGIAYLIAGAGWLLRVEPLARLENVFFFVPAWAVWLGIVIWRNPDNV